MNSFVIIKQNLQHRAFTFSKTAVLLWHWLNINLHICWSEEFLCSFPVLVNNITVSRQRSHLYLYQNQQPQSVFRQLQKAQRPIVGGVRRMSCLSKWQWEIVCLRGGHRTMVHAGVSECNTLYQTRIYWFVHSTASLGHKSHFRDTPIHKGNLLPETKLDCLKT